MGDSTKYFAPRTCTLVDEPAAPVRNSRHAHLDVYSDAAAYVLIAEPGAGKTIAFETEAARQGGAYETVRNFLRLDKPDWRGRTLFLDGLDESRAGPGDARTPLDDVIRKLDSLGRPPFRLSCRWRDWLAANDKEGLREVSPDRAVVVIRLDPLSDSDIRQILVKNHGVHGSRWLRRCCAPAQNPQPADEPAEPRVAGEGGRSRQLARVPTGHL